MELPTSPEDLADILLGQDYLADRGLATSTFLALKLGRPLLLEGEAGVGKTELSKAIAAAFGLQLIRLQCYEGIDANQALYEWDYTRQLLYVRTLTEAALGEQQHVDDIFGPRFLVERPLLKAIKAGEKAVLLVDEIDRADDEFEAFLLEVLSDFQVTIPELGTIKCAKPPVVILTSNRTRELHDALRRRCLFHWIDYPKLDREVDIVHARAPEITEDLARQVSKAVANIRKMDLQKAPGLGGMLGPVEQMAGARGGGGSGGHRSAPQQPPKLRAPEVVGLRLAEAWRVADAARITLDIAEGPSGDNDRIVDQEPEPGGHLDGSAAVTIWTEEGLSR